MFLVRLFAVIGLTIFQSSLQGQTDVAGWSQLKDAIDGGETEINLISSFNADDEPITVTKALTINGNGEEISGGTTHFEISKTGIVVNFNDLTLSEASSTALKVINGSVNCFRVNFVDNSAGSTGGAFSHAGTNAIFNACTFTNNSASLGGAVYSTAKVIIVNSTFGPVSNAANNSFVIFEGDASVGSALVNNDLNNISVNMGGIGNSFANNIHTGILEPSGIDIKNENNAAWLAVQGTVGDSYDAGRMVGETLTRYFRIDKEGDETIEDGPLETDSRAPLKYGIDGVSKPTEEGTNITFELPSDKIIYDGNLGGLPKVEVTTTVEENLTNADKFIPEDQSIKLNYSDGLVEFPGVQFFSLTLDGNDFTGTSFLAGKDNPDGDMHDIYVEYKDTSLTLEQGEINIIDPVTGIKTQQATGEDVNMTFPIRDVLLPGETLSILVNHPESFVVEDITFGSDTDSATPGYRGIDNKIRTGDMNTGEETGMIYDAANSNSARTAYTVDMTNELVNLGEDVTDQFDKKITINLTLTQPVYELFGIVDPNEVMPTVGTDVHPTGTIAERSQDSNFLPATEITNYTLDMQATPKSGYNFVGWLRWEDYNATYELHKDDDTSAYKVAEELRALGDSAFLTGLNPESFILDKNMSDSDVGDDFIFHVVALFEPKVWELDTNESMIGGIGDDIPAEITYQAIILVDGLETLVPIEQVITSDGRFYDGEKIKITVRPDSAYKFLGVDGRLHSTTEDADGVYHVLEETMREDFAPKFQFSQLDFSLEQIVSFGTEGAIKTTTRHALGDVFMVELGDESGYSFESWKLQKYSRLTGSLEDTPVLDANGTAGYLEIQQDGTPLFTESNATSENNSTITISGIREDYVLTMFYDRKAVFVDTILRGGGYVVPNTQNISYTVGDFLTLQAYADPGFKFARWADDQNQTLETNSTYVFDFLREDEQITAEFENEEYLVTIDPSMPQGFAFDVVSNRNGQLINGGPFFYGEEVVLTIVGAPPGYVDEGGYEIITLGGQFINYQVDSTDSSRLTFNVRNNATIKANLSEDLSDPDGDGLSNWQESEIWGPIPSEITKVINNPDSDDDGFIDGWEFLYGFDPTDPSEPLDGEDDDGDTLTNREENDLGTSPTDKDTDNDGITDQRERGFGWNPLKSEYTFSISKKSSVVLDSNVTNDDLGVIRRGAGGSVFENQQLVDEDDIVSIFAAEKAGFQFFKWEINWDQQQVSDMVDTQLKDLNETEQYSNPLVVEAHADLAIEAVFVPDGSFYSVIVLPHENGDVVFDPTELVDGGSLEPTEGTYLAGTEITLRAIPENGYVFGGWKGDDLDEIFDPMVNPLIFPSLDQHVVLEAIFYEKGSLWLVSGAVSDVNGSVPGRIEGLGPIANGAFLRLSAKPNSGYVFTGWQGDLSSTQPTEFLTVESNVTVTASFARDLADDDNDSLTNFEELTIHFTDPTARDSDEDGLMDDFEVSNQPVLDPNESQLSLMQLIRTIPGEPFNIPDPQRQINDLVFLSELMKDPGSYDSDLALISDLQLDPRSPATNLYVESDLNASFSDGNSSGFISGNNLGYANGYSAGFSDGNNSGYKVGSSVGLSTGYAQGFADGNATGYASGYSDGNEAGKLLGFQDGNATGFLEGNKSGVELVSANPNTYDLFTLDQLNDASVDASNLANQEGYEEGVSAVQNDPAAFGISVPSASQSLYEDSERNDLYRFISSQEAPLSFAAEDLGWFYTTAHGWSWLSMENPGYLWNQTVSNWILLNPNLFETDVTSDFGKYVETGYENYPYATVESNESSESGLGSDGNSAAGDSSTLGLGSEVFIDPF